MNAAAQTLPSSFPLPPRRRVILYEGVLEMKRRKLTQTLMVLVTLMPAGVTAAAQTSEQRIEVKVVPATTVEERVANDLKEKDLRKAAEEKRAAEESARISETSPKTLLSRARTLYIESDTEFFEAEQLQNALRKRAEMDSWQMAMIDGWDKRNIADVVVDIDRPLFTFTFTYKITHRSGIILATGKVTAFDSNVAAPMLAERVVEEIRKARGETKAKK
jgi:hypothetical protein